MKVAIVCPVFPPESVASAVMAEHIADGLVAAGHKVRVITSFPSKMQGRIFPGYRRKPWERSNHPKGYQVIRVYTIFSAKSSALSRLVENFSYAVTSSLGLLLGARPDVVYMNTWPSVSTFITGLVCRLARIKYVYNLQDLYPESAAGLGHVKSHGVAFNLMAAMDRYTMTGAAAVVPNSEEFAETIVRTRGVQPSRVHVVWNWYDGRIVPEPKDNEHRKAWGADSKTCVVMYAGNVGSVAGLETVLGAAELLRDRLPCRFVLAGDGASRPALEAECARRNLDTVKFFYPLHRADLGHVQAAADIMLITTRKSLSHSEVPSKIMGYMLSGRPVLSMVDSRSNTARVMELAQCGMVGAPEDPQSLADHVESMFASDRLDDWGANARRFAVEHFDQVKMVARIVNVLETLHRNEDEGRV
jgi:colanic acid biosynthesis glycosyl transferase WcaI